jgi:colanic acid/amylovoran biosynthesis glycosyltransferase
VLLLGVLVTRRRLLVLASTFPARPEDGTPAFVRDLALEEGKRYDTLVVVPRVPGASSREVIGNVRVIRFGYFPRRWEDLADGAIIENLRAKPIRWLQVVPFLIAEALAVRRAVSSFNPDVVHAHWIIPQGVVATAVAPRIPRLITTLGGDLYALNAGPLRLLKSWVVRRASHTTVMNAEMASVVESLGAEGAQVSVEPMGASFAVEIPSRPRRALAKNLLFVGRLVEKKGLRVLLQALRGMDGATAQLTVVGDGPLFDDLAKHAEGLPVTFAGQLGRTELLQEYARADIIVVPSVPASSGDKDGLPVALLEAMGSGLAVVASDLPGINEAVRDGVDGVLVPPSDIEALRTAVLGLVHDPERVRELGDQAAARAQNFSVGRVGARYRALLAEIGG